VQELRLENHLKDERIIKYEQLTATLADSMMESEVDQTLKGHLRHILSATQYEKIKKILKEVGSVDKI